MSITETDTYEEWRAIVIERSFDRIRLAALGGDVFGRTFEQAVSSELERAVDYCVQRARLDERNG